MKKVILVFFSSNLTRGVTPNKLHLNLMCRNIEIVEICRKRSDKMLTKKRVFNRYSLSLSDTLAELAFNAYKKIRIYFSEIKPLSEHEKYHFLEPNMIVEKVASKIPNGFNYIERHVEEGFLKLEYLDVFDYLPKENLELFEKEMKKFVSKNKISPFGITRSKKDMQQIDNFGQYIDGTTFTNLSTIKLTNSSLSKYCDSISLSLRNLSSTFLLVKYRFHIKKEFNKRIDMLCKTQYKGCSTVFRQYNIPWYSVKRFGKSFHTGDDIRKKKIYESISNLKWEVLKELRRYFTINFWEREIFPPCFETYSTNIRPSKELANYKFWNSVMFDRAADYSPKYNLCVCWDYNHSTYEGVRLAAYCGGKYKNGIESAEIATYEISNTYATYVTANTLRLIAERDIAICNKKISKAIRNKKVSKILKVRVTVDRKLYYCYRFINEFTGNSLEFDGVSDFVNEFYKKGSISSRSLQGLSKHTKVIKKQIDNILKLLNDAADYSSSEANISLQRMMMFITILSLLLALASSEGILTFLKSVFNNLMVWISTF